MRITRDLSSQFLKQPDAYAQRDFYRPYYRHSEQGVVLMVVLLFLILIMLVGVIAVHQSRTDLKTATADQINTALLHASDSANQKLETIFSGNPDTPLYKATLSYAGVFGHFLQDPDAFADEYVYCFTPNNWHDLKNNATIKRDKGVLDGMDKGLCDYTNADHYTSARQTLMTQVNIQPTPNKDTDEAFSSQVLGQDTSTTASKKHRFDIRATSFLPSYSEPTDCLALDSIAISATSTTSSPLLGCLRNRNTPSKMLYQQGDVENITTVKMCVPFGSGSLASCVVVPSASS